MSIVETAFGSIEARPKMEYYPSGVLRACSPQKESPLKTEYGVFIPQYCGDELRKRQIPYLTYHESGMINVLPLQEQVEIEIPQGRIPVEKVTFYPDGKLKRLFPLDGCLSGYWGEEDERGLARPIKLKTPAGELEALIISIYLSPEGGLRSLTFWPGETVKISTPVGELNVKTGLSYYDSGQLKSVEPENPVSVETPVGKILAYDPDAIGITGDRNSIKFSEAGELISLKTVSNMFVVKEDTGDIKRVEPPLRYSPLDGETLEPSPLTVTFMEGFVCLSAEKMQDVVARTENVTARRYAQLFAM
jgi:hypothetical protein